MTHDDRAAAKERAKSPHRKPRRGKRPGRHANKKGRPAPPVGEGRLVVGLQPVREALRAHATHVSKLLLAERGAPRLASIEELAGHFSIPIDVVGRATLDRLAHGTSHQGVAALAPELTLLDLEQWLSARDLLGVALDGIQDPQNFGAIIRSSVAVGNASVLWAEHGSAPLTPATFRASAGAVEHARLCRVSSLSAALLTVAQRDVQVIGLDAHADKSARDLDLTRPSVLVIGAEDRGLSPPVRRACTVLANLVQARTMDSLNASAAAAVALYEAHIQRSPTKDKAKP